MRVIVFLYLVAVVSGEVIDIKTCDGVVEDRCTFNEIRITPCPNKTKCRFDRGSNATISFDFVPNFSTSKLKNDVTWKGLPWREIAADACLFTTCPTEAGKAQTYTGNMHIGKKLPSGTYKFKWNVMDETDASNTCCFEATVYLKK